MTRSKKLAVITADLICVGARMANLCFTFSQPNVRTSAYGRQLMKECQIEWDKTRDEYWRTLKGGSRRKV